MVDRKEIMTHPHLVFLYSLMITHEEQYVTTRLQLLLNNTLQELILRGSNGVDLPEHGSVAFSIPAVYKYVAF